MDIVPNENLTISQDFVQQVRELLEHLYDFPYLQKQLLTLPLLTTEQLPIELGGQKARKLVLDAVEKIGLEKDLSFRSSKARTYNLLRLHYIEGMAIQQVAQELGLSQRQAYRDLRSGDERIASIVWENLANHQLMVEKAIPEVAKLQTESQFLPTNLNELINVVCNTLRPLTAQRSVSLNLHLPDHRVIIPTDAMIARQVITGVLSLAIQKALTGPLMVNLATQDDNYLLKVTFNVTGALEITLDPSIIIYANNLGWSLYQEMDANQVEMIIKINPRQQTCLVIDDHQGFIELLERYLTDQTLHIVAANDGPKGIELAQQLQPRVILLDVMVPKMDGWQILQRLHSTPATRAIPVVICSVFYDPDLASTLGAVGVLKKPVRKEDLVSTFKKIGIL